MELTKEEQNVFDNFIINTKDTEKLSILSKSNNLKILYWVASNFYTTIDDLEDIELKYQDSEDEDEKEIYERVMLNLAEIEEFLNGGDNLVGIIGIEEFKGFCKLYKKDYKDYIYEDLED